jgi:hypothetical protein
MAYVSPTGSTGRQPTGAASTASVTSEREGVAELANWPRGNSVDVLEFLGAEVAGSAGSAERAGRRDMEYQRRWRLRSAGAGDQGV